ncbi:MAG TPA: hypothetical protein VNC13_01755 [Propionibacteriaceae bacterium]|jgi:CubicO group peptidase (beta-lactamase class C family)|nr:hypothetical protein [Propionibacteriaceae bacterium]
MTTSYASYPEARQHGAAHGHRYWFGVPRPVDIHYHRAITPAGYLTASAQDMAHYLVAQLNGGSYAGARASCPLKASRQCTVHRSPRR